MVASVVPVTVLQAGAEGTAGTLAAATHVVDHTPGTGQVSRDISKIKVTNAGSYASMHRSYAGQEVTTVSYTAPATYDRLVTPFLQVLNGTAAASGTAANKTWSFTTISDTTDDLASYSFELGGPNWPSVYKVAGVKATSLEINITHDQPWEYTYEGVGMAVTVGTAVTSGLSLPSTLVDILGTNTKVYVDTAGGTIGTTQLTGVVVSASISLGTGMTARHTLDGQAYPYRIARSGRRSVEAKLVIEYASQTEYTAWAADTERLVRIEATGPSLGTGTYKATLNLYGIWDALELGDDGDVKTLELTLAGRYNSTAAAEVTATLVNSISSAP